MAIKVQKKKKEMDGNDIEDRLNQQASANETRDAGNESEDSFEKMLRIQKEQEQRKASYKDQETLDLSGLSDEELKNKLKELNDAWRMVGWNPITKKALVLKEGFAKKMLEKIEKQKAERQKKLKKM